MDTPTYRNPTATIDARLADLLGRMTLEEKLAQLSAVWLTIRPGSGDFAPYQGAFAPSPGVMEEVLRHGVGQLSRPLGSGPTPAHRGAAAINAFQRRMREETRLGIPAIIHEECLSGLVAEGATTFPCPLAYGATWDPALIGRVGAAIGRQMRSVGAHQGLGPVLDVVRDARWGRVEECIAEDPLLVGTIASAFVEGLQSAGALATLKHFAGYSGSEGGRNSAPLHAGTRELRDVFLPPFEMAVRAGAASVMSAYQDNDGVPCSTDRALLTDLLRGQWGFGGTVVADYFAVAQCAVAHGVAADLAEAAALTLKAGLDVELPVPNAYFHHLPEALRRGLIDGADIDTAVARVLRQKLALGLFEDPYVDERAASVDSPADRALSREVATASLVLLKNDGFLPFEPATCGRVAVIGPIAEDGWAFFGNYTWHKHVGARFPDSVPPPPPSLAEMLAEALGKGRVQTALGCPILAERFPQVAMRLDDHRLSVEREAVIDDASQIAAAVDAAHRADLVVLALGDSSGHFRTGTVGEGSDTDDLRLPGAQDALATAVLDTGKPVVLALNLGRPYAIGPIVARARATLLGWLPGPFGAEAIVDALLGRANPSGRLTVSFPSSTGQSPYAYNHKHQAAGVPVVRGFAPAFPFGHGLSYTRFSYSEPAFGSGSIPTDGSVEIAITVRNEGGREGAETVQLYVRDLVGSVTRPVLELKGFVKVHLKAGESTRVAFTLPAEALAFTGRDMRLVVEPGEHKVMIGASSTDIRAEASLMLTGRAHYPDKARTMVAAGHSP